jgi:hypothetical protein
MSGHFIRAGSYALLFLLSLGYPAYAGTLGVSVLVGNQQVKLTWTAPANTSSQSVCWSATPLVSPFKNCKTANNAATTLLANQTSPSMITGLTNGKFYYFAVILQDTTGSITESSLLTAMPLAAQLNDTGVTGCYNGTLKNQPCPVAQYPGQDAQFGRDKRANNNADGHAGFSFTKISSTGHTLSASSTNWDCVKDNTTGLTWEVKTTDGGLRDMNNSYGAYNGNPTDDPSGYIFYQIYLQSGIPYDTYSYTLAVNKVGLCGKKDWRLPTVQELVSIVDYGVYDPSIDTTYFPNTAHSDYYASNYHADPTQPHTLWCVYFDNGSIGQSCYSHIRLVRP